MRRASVENVWHSFHRETTSTGRGLFREELRMVGPDGGVTSGAAHQTGSQRMTVILVVSILCLVSLGMMNEPLEGCYHHPCTV
jgi:hypothetical protein